MNRPNGSEIKRIILPYFLAGSGHLVSATAIAHYLREKKPDWDIKLFEPADELESDLLDRYFIRSWRFVLKNPIFSRITFFLSQKLFSFIPQVVIKRVAKKTAGKMAEYLREAKPDLILTTHWGCGHLVNAARSDEKNHIPLCLVRNDLGGAYRLQNCGCDITFIMSEEAVQAFKSIGVPPENLMQVNPLVRPEFVAPNTPIADDEDVSGAAKKPFRVLLSSGGEGLGDIAGTADIIVQAADRNNAIIAIDIITGRNVDLKAQLENSIHDERITIHGYRDDMPVLMRRADLIVGKCGGNYTMETVMLRKPFLITQIGAPSERFNMLYVVSRGYGWYAPRRKHLKAVFDRVFSDPMELAEKRRNLSRVPRKSGAEQIADRVIAELTL